MENVTKTVPHFFYDLLARVLPGLFFLILFKIEGLDKKFEYTIPVDAISNISALLNGLAFIVMAYFVGWFLSALSFRKILRLLPDKYQINSDKFNKGHHLRKEYYEIRIRNPDAGFGLLKLRAEARLLEASRTGTFLLSIIILIKVLIKCEEVNIVTCELVFKQLILPLLFLFGFHIALRSAWKRYYKAIEFQHEFLINKKGDLEKNAQQHFEDGPGISGRV